MNRILSAIVCSLLTLSAASGCGKDAMAGPFSVTAKRSSVPSSPVPPKVKADPPAPAPSPSPAPTPAPDPKPMPCPETPTCPTCPEIEPSDAPILSLPTSVTGEVGEPIKITATTNAKQVRWMVLDKGLHLWPSDTLKSATMTVVWALKPGDYRMVGYTAVGSQLTDPVKCTVTVTGDPTPLPVPPAPAPAPTPGPAPTPNPPAPTPVVNTAPSLWIVTIDNAISRPPALSALMGNTIFWASVKTAGHQVAQLSMTDPQAIGKFLSNNTPATDGTITVAQAIAAAGGPPVVIIMDAKTGRMLNKLTPTDIRIPADVTAQSMTALLNKYVSK